MATNAEATQSTESSTENSEELDLSFKIDEPSSCVRHVVVTIPRAEVDKYYRNAFTELQPKAELPGFRPGKAPRKLVESRFKEQISEQVKSSLLMDSLEKITEGDNFSAITEPDINYGAIKIPDDGDFTYEFSIEVRPDFDLPEWKGLALERPTQEIGNEAIEEQLSQTLTRFNLGEAVDDAVQEGDLLTVNITFSHDGKEVSSVEEEQIVLRPILSFADGIIEKFGEKMVGAVEDETRSFEVTVSEDSQNEELKGQTVTADVSIVEAKRIRSDALTPKSLEMLGFDEADELRDFVKTELTRQFEYHQQKSLRSQVVDALLVNADWELPPELVRRQTSRELQRQALELRRSGFDDSRLKTFLNAAQRNMQESTERALREHFVLEKLAEIENIEPSGEDYDKEVELIAEQSDESVRAVRSQLEKSGQMDALRNQIVERKVIELVVDSGKVTDVDADDFLKTDSQESAITHFVAPVKASVPEAQYDERPEDSVKEGATVKPD